MIKTTNKILILIIFMLIFLSCDKNLDGPEDIKWEFISTENLDFTHKKGEITINASTPGSINFKALENATYLSAVLINNEYVDYYDNRFSEDRCLYEDDNIIVSIVNIDDPNHYNHLLNKEVAITVKNVTQKSRYEFRFAYLCDVGTLYLNIN